MRNERWMVVGEFGPLCVAVEPGAERVAAAVDLIAALHTRAACHPLLPDVRRSSGDLGLPYFTANVRDAVAALETLAASGLETPPEHAGVPARLLERLSALLADVPRRALAFERAAGPDTLLHGDLWTSNVFVADTAQGLRARFVDWDRVGVGPFSYDLSTFLFRYPPAERPPILARYRDALARAGWHLSSLRDLEILFDTAERARYANRVIWPARALLRERADWGFPELAEVERWFQALDQAAASGGGDLGKAASIPA